MFNEYDYTAGNEGFSATVYTGKNGHNVIGYGSDIDALQITRDTGALILSNDMRRLEINLLGVQWYDDLSVTRTIVVLDIAYNVGWRGLLKFVKMIAALKSHDYVGAAKEILDSEAALELPVRYKRNAYAMRYNKFN